MPRSLSTVGVYIDWLVLLSGHQKQLTQEELALVCFLATKHRWKDEPRESNTQVINTQVIHTQIYIQIPREGLIDSNKVMEDKGRQSLKWSSWKLLETVTRSSWYESQISHICYCRNLLLLQIICYWPMPESEYQTWWTTILASFCSQYICRIDLCKD